ncbi:Transport protein Sec61, alpha subunit [Trachipleistophora hominis]|uniref:Transport protein Sec61, alpha subunit n=1 Tax=Trachipleistophora hominis TaxID=72359 RepID=L7JTG1_TRAHO|nr:Transport protein Sec61, alpha subunit [Trachipleistophora hominis]
MAFRALSLIKPFVPFLPEVQLPGREINFQEKFVWTGVALLIYLVSSQVPLFGILNTNSADPFYWMRMMMASNRGTLMDLGISPVVTSSMIMQMLSSLEIVRVNSKVKEDQTLYSAASKLLAVLLTVGQSIVQVSTGFYGPTSDIGIQVSLLLVIQLFFSGIIIILLDELLQKGYGLGSGVNLFIATNVCESIVWKALSPKMHTTARGIEFEGSLIALFHLLFVRKNKLYALHEAFFRENLPNMMTLTSTLFIFALVIYVHGVRVNLRTESLQVKGQQGNYPIKLLYSSTMPIIVQNYIISHASTVSRFLYQKFPDVFLVRLLGVWTMRKNGKMVPISGICYFLFPPDSLMDIFRKPLYFMVYTSIVLLSSAFLSRAWIDMTESNQNDVARSLINRRVTIKGVPERNLANKLGEYIPTAAFLGGLVIGFIVMLSNILDTIGSGTNIFLAVSIVWQYCELFNKEAAKRGGLLVVD